MANGDLVTLDARKISYKLLDAQSASDNGVWVELPANYSIRSFWCDLTAEAGGSPQVEIMVSNASSKPSNATDGVVTKALTYVSPAGTVTESYKWVKAKKTAGSTPAATTCIVEASRND